MQGFKRVSRSDPNADLSGTAGPAPKGEGPEYLDESKFWKKYTHMVVVGLYISF